jgi:hypothetical protein
MSETITGKSRRSYNNTWSIIVDIDGCLADWNARFYDLLVQLHGLPVVAGNGAEDIWSPEFSTWDWPRTECGYTKEQIDAAWAKVNDTWWLRLAAYPGAEEALDMLQWLDYSEKAQVTFVTGRYPSARSASRGWLSMHGFDAAHILTTSRKEAVAKAFAANGPVAVIEDKPSLIEGYTHSDYVSLVYVIDQPYNRETLPKFSEAWKVHRMPATLDAVKHFEDQITLEKW